MAIITFHGMPLNLCNGCGYVWKPHKDSRGVSCAKCHSSYWNGTPAPRKVRAYAALTAPRQRITKPMLLEAIASFNGHTPSLQEIGDIFGVSRERIRQRCVRLGIKRIKAQVANAFHCVRCGETIYGPGPLRKKAGLCIRCKPVLFPKLTIICGYCIKPFLLSQAEYNTRMRLRSFNGLRTTPRTWPLFCSKSCSGGWFGTHYHGTHRKEFCKRGHKLEGVTEAERDCKPCNAILSRKHYLAKKAQTAVGVV